MSHVSCSYLEPDVSSWMPRWIPGLRSSLCRNLLKYLCSLPVSHVKLWGACRAQQWGRHLLAPLHRNLSKKGTFLKVSFANHPAKHLGPQHGSAEPDSLQRGWSSVAEERGKALSHHHTPFADNTLDMLHYVKSLSPAARTHFATQKCKCNSPI